MKTISKGNWNFWSCTLAIMLAISLVGCVSQIPRVKDWADQGIGLPIRNLFGRIQDPGSYVARTHSKIGKYKLDNGHFVYTEPVWTDCVVHWEVNADEIIVGYRMDGKCDF